MEFTWDIIFYSWQVQAAPDRQFAAFIGAAVLACLETFDDLCISRDEWEQSGPELLARWDGVQRGYIDLFAYHYVLSQVDGSGNIAHRVLLVFVEFFKGSEFMVDIIRRFDAVYYMYSGKIETHADPGEREIASGKTSFPYYYSNSLAILVINRVTCKHSVTRVLCWIPQTPSDTKP